MRGRGRGPTRGGRRRFKGRIWMRTLSVEQLDDNYDAWRDSRRVRPNQRFLEPASPCNGAACARAIPPALRRRVAEGSVLERRGGWSACSAGAAAAMRAADSPLWLDKQAALAAPLRIAIARGRVGGFLDWLARSGPAAGVVFPQLVEDARFTGAAGRGAALRPGRREADRFERAMLAPGSDPTNYGRAARERRRSRICSAAGAGSPNRARWNFRSRRRPRRCATRWSSF